MSVDIPKFVRPRFNQKDKNHDGWQMPLAATKSKPRGHKEPIQPPML